MRARSLLAIGAGLVALAGVASPACANPYLMVVPAPPTYTWAIGGRYWYGMGSSSGNLYGLDRTLLVSKLEYNDVDSHSGEIFGRVDFLEHGVFFKGYVGGGFLTGGKLQDHDFPPVISPYSRTESDLQKQRLAYASLDFGAPISRNPDFRLDAFIGYHYLNERMLASGCTQLASNTSICTPSIDNSVNLIEDKNTWHAVRVGLNADIPLIDRFRLNVEAVWLPYVRLDGADTHFLRIGSSTGSFTGPIPEDGYGIGYQFEAVLRYQVDEQIDVGIGGRYWHMESKGDSHFENRVVNTASQAQPMDWETQRYGVFVQARYRFGP